MAELILPGVFVEVRPEGLMLPQGVTVGNLGVVGTASKGPIDTPVILGSYAEAKEQFGGYDAWDDGEGGKLTLVRALELAFRFGATTVIAVRIAAKDDKGVTQAQSASLKLDNAGKACVELSAKSAGTWGNSIEVQVANEAEENAFVESETVEAETLRHAPVIPSSRNRINVEPGGGGLAKTLQILYSDSKSDSNTEGPTPDPGQVVVESDTGKLTFGIDPPTGDLVRASYMVAKEQAKKVTLRYQGAEEVYHVVSNTDLARDLEKSAWVIGATVGKDHQSLDGSPFRSFANGTNGAGGANYQDGLDELLYQPVHILVAAGRDGDFGDELAAHCHIASSDNVKRERIAVVGCKPKASVDDLLAHNLASDRLLYVAPGIKATDAAASPPREVVLPGSYAAAAVAGLMASYPPHVSLTNKVLSVGGLERVFTPAELKQLVLSRLLVLEQRQGHRIVKGITTSTNTAWHQITTRRIVDYAKFGVRGAANPYIGRLNNGRVRGALHTAINSFLADMVTDEMLVSYELGVTATREQEVRGIVQVMLVLRPTFSIDYIKVTMYLE